MFFFGYFCSASTTLWSGFERLYGRNFQLWQLSFSQVLVFSGGHSLSSDVGVVFGFFELSFDCFGRFVA